MKQLKNIALLKWNTLIGFLLTILGFSTACNEDPENGGGMVVMYGVPSATFVVKGNVKSETAETNIPNIRVIMQDDTTYTDNSGNYQIGISAFPKDQTFQLEFDDIDSTANGEYQSLDTIVEFKDPQFTGGSGAWNSGKTEQTLNVKLKDKE